MHAPKQKTSPTGPIPKRRHPAAAHRLPATTPPAPALALRRAVGNQSLGRLIQAKLSVNPPGDRYEHEADRVADAVMRMPSQAAPEVTFTAAPEIRRACAACASGSGPCSECEEESALQRAPAAAGGPESVQRLAEPEEEEEKLQTKGVAGDSPRLDAKTESRIQALRGRGEALPEPSRRFMEQRFGRDFSRVRVHRDSASASTAAAVRARAFTLGRDVVFGQGQYSPDSASGRRLLAHELTHVVQQGAAPARTAGRPQPAREPGLGARPAVNPGLARQTIQRRELRGEDFPWQGVVASASGAWFRKSPDLSDASKIRGLKDGTEVQVTGVSGDWLQVKHNGVDGYVHKSLVIHKFEVEARTQVAGVCDNETCRKASGCTTAECKKEAATIAETYVSRVNQIRKPGTPNVGDIHWGWMCYQWAGLLTTEFKKLSFKCWKINWVGLVGAGGSLLHNYVYVSLDNIAPSGTEAPKQSCGMILDPWRTGNPVVYDLSWSWHKWNYIHDPATDKGQSYDGSTWSGASYPPPWTPPEPTHSPTVKTP